LPVAALIETADGFENVATEPTPLARPARVPTALPPPANDVTTPVTVLTARMRLLPLSATNKVVAASALSVTLTGELKRATAPVPST
jgi:hypothetical protein